MERDRAPRAPRAAKAPRKKRRESPLPGPAVLPGRRAGPPQPCRRSLFGSAEPEPRGLKKKVSGKALPKIKENVELTEESPSCNQSNQVNVRETRDLEKEEEESEESNVSLKKSSTINIKSKENLQNAETTSSTDMTLPTGVSTFLIECLDVDSTADSNNTSGSLQSYSSPETFRDDDSERSNFYSVNLGKYKNSTLLDSSKAVTIDKIAQLSNLSAILEPIPKDFQDQGIRRKRPSNCNYSSSALGISATLSGKKLYKITAARERTPDLESGMRCASPLGPDSKPDKQTAKPKRLKRKKTGHGSNPVGEGSSSFRQLDAPGNTSARSGGLTAQVVPTKPADAVVQLTSTMLVVEENKALKNPGNAQLAQLKLSLSPVCKASPGESLFLNTTGPYVNSEEIVPASLSSEKEIIPQSPEEKNIFKPLCDTEEICSIVRLSPHQRPSRLQRVPVKRGEFSLPKGVPEDSITSTKNWICCKQR